MTGNNNLDGLVVGAFNVSEDLVQSPQHKLPGITELDFDGLLSPPLKLHEDLSKGCGGQLWPAGMVLARYLLQQPKSILANRTILELGAGGGLVGLAIARHLHPTPSTNEPSTSLRVPKIHLTDQAQLLPLLLRNIDSNLLSEYVKASILDWGIPISEQSASSPDVLLAADCVYFEPAFPLLLRTLHEIMSPETTCYFCFKKRRKADLRFINDLKKAFVVTDIPRTDASRAWNPDDRIRDGIFL